MSRSFSWILAVSIGAASLLSRPVFAAENSPAAVPAPKKAAPQPSADSAAIQNGMDVGLEYSLTVEGSVVDSTEGKQPLHYVHGTGKIIPGLEKQLAGMHVGESKEVTVTPEDGYGQVDPAAVVEVDKAKLPPDTVPAVGMILRGVNPDGQMFQARIKEIKDDKVMLDLNHPLAGKTLQFKVKVISISPIATG